VRKARSASASSVDRSQIGPWILRSGTGKTVSSHDTPKDFVEALKRAMSDAADIELLYDVWEQNIETLRVLHRSSNERPGIVWSATYGLALLILSSAPATEAYTMCVKGTAALPQRSTRAFSPSASPSASAPRSICALSQVNLVSSADARPLMRTTSATRNREDSA
jgi:hypothetical protein